MEESKTFITLENIRDFFLEECKEQKIKYSDKDYTLFLESCEKDFYEWLKENFRYFYNEYFVDVNNNL
ncbi:MAG: hypothetical protein HUU45_13635 [Leptospiraceae bacterium]|jgi:hypothetical protein|nr:hypothetical protein [Leptospiraceae bacterium]